jgi:hypothetical protein
MLLLSGRIAVFLICVFAGGAFASPITFSSLHLGDPASAFGSNDAAVSNATIFGSGYSYTYSSELCLSGACSFDAPGSPVSQTLKLSNLSLSCNGESTCGALDVTFDAAFDAAPGTDGINVALGNTSFSAESPFTGFVRICFSDASNICSANLSGNASLTVPFSNLAFSGLNSGNYNVGSGGPFQVLGLFHLDGLGPGDSINIGHSLDITAVALLGDIDPGPPTITLAPEPSTLLLIPFGIGLLALGRRRSLR